MLDDRKRRSVVERKGRHVVVIKLFVLIVTKYDDDISLGFSQNVAKNPNGFLTGLITPPHLIGSNLLTDVRLGPPKQLLVVQSRVRFVFLP